MEQLPVRRCGANAAERQHAPYEVPSPLQGSIDWFPVHIVGFNGNSNDCFSVWKGVRGQGLVALVADRLGEDLAKLVLAHGRQPVQSCTSLFDQRICTGAVLTLTRLRVPPEHNGVQYCDSCDFMRYCHYGYTWSSATMRYEPVIAQCEPCGGKHMNTKTLDDDESVSERSTNQGQSPRAAAGCESDTASLTGVLPESPQRSIEETEPFEYVPLSEPEARAQLAAKRAREADMRAERLQAWQAAGCPSPTTTESMASSPLPSTMPYT